MTATSLDLSQIKTDALSSAATFRTLIGLGSSDSVTFSQLTIVDTPLVRDAANALAQRNGANAQTFNIYNTYTSSTSYERGFLRWNSNVLEIGTEAGSGGGTVRNVTFASGTTYILCKNANDIEFYRNGTRFFAIANGLVRLYSASLWNVKDIQLQYGYTEMLDSTPPSTPSADRCRIYAKDNGSGKTQLVVLMPDGIETVLATET